jgi:hypothetical protein
MEYIQPIALLAMIVGGTLVVIDQEKAIKKWPVGGPEWVPTVGLILTFGGLAAAMIALLV